MATSNVLKHTRTTTHQDILQTKNVNTDRQLIPFYKPLIYRPTWSSPIRQQIYGHLSFVYQWMLDKQTDDCLKADVLSIIFTFLSTALSITMRDQIQIPSNQFRDFVNNTFCLIRQQYFANNVRKQWYDTWKNYHVKSYDYEYYCCEMTKLAAFVDTSLQEENMESNDVKIVTDYFIRKWGAVSISRSGDKICYNKITNLRLE